jgi:hypothetical protein
MTLGEIERAVKSKIRVKETQAKEQASFDYILSNLIGMSIGCALNSSGDAFPPIEEVYPSLFKNEEQVIQKREEKQAKVAELSILRFKQYADFHNKKFNKEVAKISE